MTAMLIHAARLAIAIPVLLASSHLRAQPVQTMPGPTPEADALAADMRILGSNPFDLQALISAGERTLKLGDMEAAAAFFQRAERINPGDGRIKAGKARTLVQLGRPGEALRLFDEAEAAGYNIAPIAADRALAYDLIGEQERAQRTYRAALKRQGDEETQRRYALSLGISGKRDAALVVLEGLLRRSDRAAWRVRAFVLAMNGDVPGANKIAASMLPSEMATGLEPFFQILPRLAPADRAFAVHFGEVRPTPERIADARLIPALPVLIPEPAPVVQVAAAAPRTRAQQRQDRRRQRDKPVQVAAVVPPAVTAPPQLPPPPRVAVQQPAIRPASPTVSASPPPMRPAVNEPPVALARTAVPNQQPATVSRTPDPAPVPRLVAAAPTVAPPPPVSGPAPTVVRPMPTTTPVQLQAQTQAQPQPQPPPQPPATPVRLADNVSGPTIDRPASTSPIAATVPPPQPGTTTATVVPAPVPAPPVQSPSPAVAQAVPPPSAPKPVASEESILARIISTIGVPAEELEVAPINPGAAPAVTAQKSAATDKQAIEKKALADKAVAKAAAEKKLAEKKIADEKAAKLKALKADPARIWVQVAGGSSTRDLPKEWSRLSSKAPAAFQSRSAYTTPLRFTNRLLTGPFKTEDAAQDFVNQIARFGLTGFVFNSEAGQKIDKLPTK